MTQFLHQRVAQQGIQSICRDCLQVVMTASHRVMLEEAERRHECPKEVREGYFTEWQLPRVA